MRIASLLLASPLFFFACSDDPAGSGSSSTSSSGSSGTSGTSGTSGGTSGSTAGVPATLTWTKGTVEGADKGNIGGIAAMAYGNGKWVALAKATFPAVNKNQFALTSTDGKTWTQSAAFPLNANIISLEFDGTQFVASGSVPVEGIGKAAYATTPDGVTWSSFVELPGELGSSVTVVPVGTTLLFAGQRGGMNVKVGAGAATAYTSPFVGHNVFAACTVGTRVITAGQIDATKDTDPPVTYSDDVSSAAGWKAGTEPTVIRRVSTRFYDLACDDTRQLAVGAGKDVWVSVDKGATWTLGHPESEGDATTWQKIEKANGKYVIVGWKGAYAVTTDGMALATATIGDSTRDFEATATDGTIVVAGAGGLFNDASTPAEFWWAQP